MGINKMENRKSYHHGNLKKTLIAITIEMLEHGSPNEISLRKVSKAAGVTHAAAYRHFKNKNDLLAAIAAQGFDVLEKQISYIESRYPNNPQQQFIEAGVAYVELAVNSPEITQLMFGGHFDEESANDVYQATSNKAYAALLSIIQNGVDAGIFINHDPQALTLSLWSIVHGFAMLKTGNQLTLDIDSEQHMRILTRMLCKMLLSGIGVIDPTNPASLTYDQGR